MGLAGPGLGPPPPTSPVADWGVWDTAGELVQPTAAACRGASLGGRKLFVLDFVDEQMASGTISLTMAMQMVIGSNRTLVEPATGSRAAHSNYHRICPAPRRLARFQRFGATYDLRVLRAAGLQVMDIDEYWLLERCGKLPAPVPVLPGSVGKDGTCMRCDPDPNGTTIFTFEHIERLHAGNQKICPDNEGHRQWKDIVMSDAPVLEACCVRKHDGAPGAHYSGGGWFARPSLPFRFNLPLAHASRFVADHGMAPGYLAVHWRSEQDKTWYKRDLEKEFVGKIDELLAKSRVSKIYFAVDFLGGGSTTINPAGKRLSFLMKLYNLICSKYDVVVLDPAKDLPEVHDAGNNMFVAAVEAAIMVRATEFLPLVPRGSFVRMIRNDRTRRILVPPD